MFNSLYKSLVLRPMLIDLAYKDVTVLGTHKDRDELMLCSHDGQTAFGFVNVDGEPKLDLLILNGREISRFKDEPASGLIEAEALRELRGALLALDSGDCIPEDQVGENVVAARVVAINDAWDAEGAQA